MMVGFYVPLWLAYAVPLCVSYGIGRAMRPDITISRRWKAGFLLIPFLCWYVPTAHGPASYGSIPLWMQALLFGGRASVAPIVLASTRDHARARRISWG